MFCKVNISYSSIGCFCCNILIAKILTLSDSSLRQLNVFNVFSFQDANVKRSFYICKLHDGCEGDIGWLLVKESVINKYCTVDNVSATTIWYSGLTKYVKFNGKSITIIYCYISKWAFLLILNMHAFCL